MKSRIIQILSLAVLILMLGACAAPAAQSTPSAITLVDGLERTVTLDKPAERIVSLTPSITEVLFAIGAGDQLVGRDSFSNFPAEASKIQDIGGSMGEYSLEAIAGLKPNLVLAGEINPPELVKSLEDLGLTVYYLPNPDGLDTLDDMLVTAGKLSGHEDEAAALSASLNERIAAAAEKVKNVQSKPLVFYELDATDPARPYTAGPGSFMDDLIQAAGGRNAGTGLQSAWAQISVEELLVQDPDIILLGDSNYGITPEQATARTGWQNLKAVKEGKIFGFNDDLVSRPGPRWVDGLEAMVKILHPELQ